MNHRAPTPSRPRPHGFTLYEVVIVAGLVMLAFSSLGPLLTTNVDLAGETRAHQRAEAAQRRNMMALTRVLRGVDIESLSGFDNAGIATQPSFGRVTGASLDDLTYEGDEQLLWQASAVAVDGVENPGAVYLQRDGKRYLVADRVPAGGFHVRQEGQNLVIYLRTYYLTSQGQLVYKSGESVVSVRN